MANNGFTNEDNIRLAINNKKLSQLNKNLRNMIVSVFGQSDDNTLIFCHKRGGVDKTDLSIEVNGVTKYISVKIGSGNSVHQEGVEDFIKFLSQNYGEDKEVFNAIRHFIWGDGSLDGKGERQNRIDARRYAKKYPENVKIIKRYFHAIKPRLVERFIVLGDKSTHRPDYMYYGDSENGICVDSDKAIEFLSDDANESNSTIPVGRLCFQAWNRALKEDTRSEHKRGEIQLKWPTLQEDLRLMYE